MKITLPIAKLSLLLEEYKQMKLRDNKEVSINDLEISVPTPQGQVKVNQFIKKFNLPVLEILLENGYRFKAAETHIVRKNNSDVYLKDISVNDIIDHRDGLVRVLEVNSVGYENCYDIAIPAPHLYYDANGVLHHNTITTATLAKICEKYGRTVTIVPSKNLVEQTEEDFINVDLDVGVYYGDRKELGRTHIICTWQSLNILDKNSKNNEELLSLAEFLDNVQTVIVDEVHQAKGPALKKLLTQNIAHAPIRWGLTGTIPKEEISQLELKVALGEVVHKVRAVDLQEKGVLSNCHVNIVQTAEWKEFGSYPEELKYLVTNEERMRYISKMIREISNDGNTLVLVDRIECGKLLISNIPDSVFISGEVKTKDRKQEYDEVKIANNKVIVATYGVAAVGINIPRLFNIVLIEPGKSFVRVIQSIGRGLRRADDKDHVNIYDITASSKYAKKHLTDRKRFYKEAEYPFSIKKVSYI